MATSIKKHSPSSTSIHQKIIALKKSWLSKNASLQGFDRSYSTFLSISNHYRLLYSKQFELIFPDVLKCFCNYYKQYRNHKNFCQIIFDCLMLPKKKSDKISPLQCVEYVLVCTFYNEALLHWAIPEKIQTEGLRTRNFRGYLFAKVIRNFYGAWFFGSEFLSTITQFWGISRSEALFSP